MNDKELIRMMKMTPREGQRLLFEEYYNYVYAITMNILRGIGTSQDIEESVINTFTRIFKSLELEKERKIKPFIGTVAKNCALSMRKSLSSGKQKNYSLEDEELSSLSTDERIEENSDNKELSRLLLEHVEALGEPDSTIIIQKYFYERNSTEIGKILGMAPAAVRMRCGRALERLKIKLDDII